MSVLRGQALSMRRSFLVFVIVALAPLHHAGIQAAQVTPVPYKHAYYLFLDGDRTGCEACYVPLLITQSTLEQIAGADTFEEGMLIITYERDSIWQSKGMEPLHAQDIEPGPRIVRLNSKRYRYQEISAKEVLKLLENPMGSIPISRIMTPGMPPDGPSLAQLIRDFKKQ